MLSLGLDIGTTSISLAVIDKNNRVVDSATLAHDAFIDTPNPWEKLQDAGKLLNLALDEVKEMCEKHRISCIGITGQQHGIVYLDKDGSIVSPLYTWQDARALRCENGNTYLEQIKEKCGWTLSSGFGLATHYYNVKNGLLTQNTVCFATIADVVAMRLAGRTSPEIEASNAHSLGMFDIEANNFNMEAVDNCGLDTSLLPRICKSKIIGYYHEIPVAVAIGDNQASFIGATGDEGNAILVNVGTGGQISLCVDRISHYAQMELRPYPLGGYLLVGASLCGGRTWALTEKFFRETVKAFTGVDRIAYDGLNSLLDNTKDMGDFPRVNTCFDGTRNDPTKRGSIDNISIDNFTPGQFAFGILHGMADELFEMYSACLGEGLAPKSRLIGSGNGLRLNRHLQRVTEQTFNMRLEMSENVEEASTGAAIFAKCQL